jgi:transposase
MLYLAGWDAREISIFFHNRPSVATVYRYVFEYQSDPEYRVPEPLSRSNGRRCILSEGRPFVLLVSKNCMQTLSGRNCVQFLDVSAGISVSRSTISRELVHRLGMTWQCLTSQSSKRDEEQAPSIDQRRVVAESLLRCWLISMRKPARLKSSLLKLGMVLGVREHFEQHRRGGRSLPSTSCYAST